MRESTTTPVERASSPPDSAAAAPQMGPGVSLPADVRSRLRAGFGAQVDRVSLHTGAEAQQTAAVRGLRGFAHGSRIGLAAGAYRPDDPESLALIAHELAHTRQQAGRESEAGAPTTDAEVEANRHAISALAGKEAPEPRRRSGLALQGCPSDSQMSREDIQRYLSDYTFRLVLLQDTTTLLQGMQKTVAVEVNSTPRSGLVHEEGETLVTYGMDFPRLSSVTVTYPSGGRRPSTPSRASGAFIVHFTESGPTTVSATVHLTPSYSFGVTRVFDAATPDFVGASEAAVTPDLAFRSQSMNEALLAAFTQSASTRREAVTHGWLNAAVDDAYADLVVGVLTRLTAIEGGEGPDDEIASIRSARNRFRAAMRAEPNVLAVYPLILASEEIPTAAAGSDAAALRRAMRTLHDMYLEWLWGHIDEHSGDEVDDVRRRLRYAQKTESELARIRENAATEPVQLPAEFHPQVAYLRRQFTPAAQSQTGRILSLPLRVWVYRTAGGDWKLTDVTDPENRFEYTVDDVTDHRAAIDALLERYLSDGDRWAEGRVYVHVPGHRRVARTVEGSMSWATIIGLIGLALAAAGFALVTAGGSFAVAGGIALTLAGGAGVASAVVDMVEANERGQLTAGRIGINALQIVASVATMGTATMVTRAAASGRSAVSALGTSARYLVLNRAAAGSDIAVLALMTVDAAQQLARVNESSSPNKAMHASMIVAQLIVQGAFTAAGARDAFGGPGLRGHPDVDIHIDAEGRLVITRPGASPEVLPRGAVMGPDVYPLGNTRTVNGVEVGALSPSRMNQELTRLGRRRLVSGGQYHHDGPDAGRIVVTASDGSQHTVDVQFARTDDLPPSTTHVPAGGGASEAGPARVDLIPPANPGDPWRARVTVDGRLSNSDVQTVLGHELDEIADIVARNPGATPAVIAREMEAGVFRRGVDPQNPPQPTAHDRAAAGELFDKFLRSEQMLDELQQLRGMSTGDLNQQQSERLSNLPGQIQDELASAERLAQHMGLYDGTHLESRMSLLRRAAEERGGSFRGMHQRDMRAEWEEVIQGFRTLEGGRLLAAHGTPFGPRGRGLITTMTDEVIAHMRYPEPHSPIPGTDMGRFRRNGIGGGHDDVALRQFVDAHPEYGYALRVEAHQGGYTSYSQWMWNGGGRAPAPGSAGHPSGAGPVGTGWVRSEQPKTTVASFDAFLVDAERALYAWIRHPSRHARFGPGGTAAQSVPFQQKRHGGPIISGFFDFTPPDGFRLRTAFIDASWF